MSLLDILIFLPLIAAGAILSGGPAKQLARGVAVLQAALATYVFGVCLLYGKPGEYLFQVSRTVLAEPEISFAVGVDGMGAILVLLTGLVSLCALWLVPTKLEKGQATYYTCVLLISGGVMGAFCSTDVFFFYAFHELALIPTFLMIGLFGHGPDRSGVAWKITIYLGAASLVLLAGLIWLVQASGTGSFAMDKLLASAGSISAADQKWIAFLLFAGFGALVSLFPLHSWAAPAYAAAPAPVAMLHAGVLKKFGLYGLIRLAVPLLPEGIAYWEPVLLILLLGNIIFIGFVTISQRFLDRMLGYSSVMHMGYVFLGIVAMNEVALNGAILMMFAHGISIALLFALCEKLRQRVPTLEIRNLGGIATVAPFLAVLFGFATFASIGLPGFANFTSELIIFLGAFQGGVSESGFSMIQIVTIIALWGVVISAVYMLRAYRRVFHGEPGPDSAALVSGQARMRTIGDSWCYLLLLGALLLVGVFPNFLLNLL